MDILPATGLSHFRTELRIKIDALETELDWLELRMARGEAGSEQLVLTHLERLSRQLAHRRRSPAGAEADLTGWAAHAHNRACAAMDAAAAAIDEAVRAALEAWLAQKRSPRPGSVATPLAARSRAA